MLLAEQTNRQNFPLEGGSQADYLDGIKGNVGVNRQQVFVVVVAAGRRWNNEVPKRSHLHAVCIGSINPSAMLHSNIFSSKSVQSSEEVEVAFGVLNLLMLFSFISAPPQGRRLWPAHPQGEPPRQVSGAG